MLNIAVVVVVSLVENMIQLFRKAKTGCSEIEFVSSNII